MRNDLQIKAKLRALLRTLGVVLRDDLAVAMSIDDYRATIALVRGAGWQVEWLNDEQEGADHGGTGTVSPIR